MTLAIFVMSCGTAPMFFFLLILRDFVEVPKQKLVKDFAMGSMIFFLLAAFAAALDFTCGSRSAPGLMGMSAREPTSPRSHLDLEKEKLRRLNILVFISVLFAMTMVGLSLTICFQTPESRTAFFFPMLGIFGFTFGLGFSRFQDATWRLLPNDCDMANSMGFNVMARNFGLGLGNFFFGAMLELFKRQGFRERVSHETLYEKQAYSFMFYGCMALQLGAGFIAYRITWLISDPDRAWVPDSRMANFIPGPTLNPAQDHRGKSDKSEHSNNPQTDY